MQTYIFRVSYPKYQLSKVFNANPARTRPQEQFYTVLEHLHKPVASFLQGGCKSGNPCFECSSLVESKGNTLVGGFQGDKVPLNKNTKETPFQAISDIFKVQNDSK